MIDNDVAESLEEKGKMINITRHMVGYGLLVVVVVGIGVGLTIAINRRRRMKLRRRGIKRYGH